MNAITFIAKNLNIQHNVSIRVIDESSGKVISEHTGHNAATNSMLFGIAHYLIGDGVLNQGSYMLSNYIPRYISLGTMGLYGQDEDAEGLPMYLGGRFDASDPNKTLEEQEIDNLNNYIEQCPGYGADGYDANANNGRLLLGLGNMYTSGSTAINCELISKVFPRSTISFKDIVPEKESEFPETIDVVFSAFVSTGALKQFRNGADHIFITEAGLWSRRDWSNSGDNGLLAGYRIAPSSKDKLDMSIEENRNALKSSIIRVGINQIVQVIWKIQLGSIGEFSKAVKPIDNKLKWIPFIE